MPVINCKKCSKIFEKRLSDLCPDCLKIDEENFRVIYRLLQKSAAQGGSDINDLATETSVSTEDIEQMYLDGRFGTAGGLLKFHCQSCDVLVGGRQRKGRFCNECSEKTAQQAGVEIKSTSKLEKEQEEERVRQQQAALLRKNQTALAIERQTRRRRFGMGRDRH